MSRSLHTDPYPIRAARRVATPRGRRRATPAVLRRRARQPGPSGTPAWDPSPTAEDAPPHLQLRGVSVAPARVPPDRSNVAPHRIPVRQCPARPGFTHAATALDIARTLDFFGPEVAYGLRGVELRHAVGTGRSGPLLATLRMPGVVVLHEQPRPPWVIAGRLAPSALERLRRAGARVDTSMLATRIDWPGSTLREFVLFDGLMHEIGHHVIQQRTGKRTARIRRTADHERQADAFAAQCRLRWAARTAAR